MGDKIPYEGSIGGFVEIGRDERGAMIDEIDRERPYPPTSRSTILAT
jgi:hypothetical protein